MKYVIGNANYCLETEESEYNLGNINTSPVNVDNSDKHSKKGDYNNESHIIKLKISYLKFNNQIV